MSSGIFSPVVSALQRLGGGGAYEYDDKAVPTLVEMISCPYCGSFFPSLTLGLLRKRVYQRPFVFRGESSVANPAFAETHLANPVKCPVCNRKFRVFVGIEYDGTRIKRVDVKALREEESRDLIRWPHRGLVLTRAVRYNGVSIEVYASIKEMMEAVSDSVGEPVYSLPQAAGDQTGAAAASGGGSEGQAKPRPIDVVRVGDLADSDVQS